MTKKYNIIYADPPWSFNSVRSGGSMKSGAAAKYQTMTLDELKALDVAALCEKDCVLVMWYVSSQPQEALDLVKAWGFTLKNMNAFIWRKLSTNLIPHFGMGYWTRAGAECALIAVRGKPKAECRSIRQVRDEVVGEHSEKPAIFRDEIVKLCGDLPRLEMFARVSAPGWDVFGNEVDNSVSIDNALDDDNAGPCCPGCGQNCDHVELAGYRTFCQPCFDKLPPFPKDGRGYNPEQQADGSWLWVTTEPELCAAKEGAAA